MTYVIIINCETTDTRVTASKWINFKYDQKLQKINEDFDTYSYTDVLEFLSAIENLTIMKWIFVPILYLNDLYIIFGYNTIIVHNHNDCSLLFVIVFKRNSDIILIRTIVKFGQGSAFFV